MRYLLLICLKEEKSGAGKFANNTWDKFGEKHHMRVPKKRYRNYYAKKRFADWFVEKMLFPLGCVLFAVVVFVILIHFDLIWYMW